ncbi:MAG: hypothetical protein ACPGVT_12605 [Maricaulaceae bacterium]
MNGYSGMPLPWKLGLTKGQAALLLGVLAEVANLTEFAGFTRVYKNLRGE